MPVGTGLFPAINQTWQRGGISETELIGMILDKKIGSGGGGMPDFGVGWS
jgi:hypothetical protein